MKRVVIGLGVALLVVEAVIAAVIVATVDSSRRLRRSRPQ